MGNYYLGVTIRMRLVLMGKKLSSRKKDILIPPIEKGVEQIAESLTEEIYSYISSAISYTHFSRVEDLNLELSMEGHSLSTHHEVQLVEKNEAYYPGSSSFDARIRYCMVRMERDLVKILAEISSRLYD